MPTSTVMAHPQGIILVSFSVKRVTGTQLEQHQHEHEHQAWR